MILVAIYSIIHVHIWCKTYKKLRTFGHNKFRYRQFSFEYDVNLTV